MMKNFIKLFALMMVGLISSCKAQTQTTISLQQMEECRKRPNRGTEGCPDLEDAQFVKDVGNRLNKFEGIWKGTYNGKNYELKLEKKENFGNYSIKWDKLIGKLRVKDGQGNIIYDSMNKPDNKTSFWGVNFQGTAYEMSFFGNTDCLEEGVVFVEVLSNPSNGNTMTVSYHQDAEWLDPAKCPNYSTFVPLLPSQKMILIKQ